MFASSHMTRCHLGKMYRKEDHETDLEDLGCMGRTQYVANYGTVLVAPTSCGILLSSGAVSDNTLNSLMHMCLDSLMQIG